MRDGAHVAPGDVLGLSGNSGSSATVILKQGAFYTALGY